MTLRGKGAPRSAPPQPHAPLLLHAHPLRTRAPPPPPADPAPRGSPASRLRASRPRSPTRQASSLGLPRRPRPAPFGFAPLTAPPSPALTPRRVRKGPDPRGGVGGGPPPRFLALPFSPRSPSLARLSAQAWHLRSVLSLRPQPRLFPSLLILVQPRGPFASPPSPNQIRFKTVAHAGRPA